MGLSYPLGRRRNVLVIAPHPDDDAIGCGGTLRRLAAGGARVAVVYVTDGSASHRKSLRFPPPALRAVRESEARAALRILGVRTTPQFLRAPDSRLDQVDSGVRAALVAAIARRVAALRPAAVFGPWLRDPHPDHIATAGIVAAALARGAGRAPLYYYGVWLAVRGAAGDVPLVAEARACEVRLRPADVARKRRAILAHRSQTGALIDDDADGFRIDADLLATWLQPVERLYRAAGPGTGAS